MSASGEVTLLVEVNPPQSSLTLKTKWYRS